MAVSLRSSKGSLGHVFADEFGAVSNNIYVSCAPAGVGSGANTGMNTVDFAIHSILGELKAFERVKLVRPWPAYIDSNERGLSRQKELDNWPMQFDYSMDVFNDPGTSHCIYWGDFQHGRDYIYRSAERLQSVLQLNGKQMSFEDSYARCADHFLLRSRRLSNDMPEVGSFGGTIFQNGATDYADPTYRDDLVAIFTNATLLKLRDPYSAYKASAIRNDFSTSYLGVDPAFLNTPAELLGLVSASPAEAEIYDGAIGVFLGRSSRSFPWISLGSFLRRLSRNLRLRSAWIHWERHSGDLLANSRRKLQLLVPSLQSIDANVDFTSGDILHSINSCEVVLTDTYHVAVNALVLGKPCICLYEPAPDAERNANMGFHISSRDKRMLLYLSYDLSDFLMSTADLSIRKWRQMKLEHLTNIIKDSRSFENPMNEIAATAKYHRENIKSFIKNWI